MLCCLFWCSAPCLQGRSVGYVAIPLESRFPLVKEGFGFRLLCALGYGTSQLLTLRWSSLRLYELRLPKLEFPQKQVTEHIQSKREMTRRVSFRIDSTVHIKT
ncbi:hypothetical protein F4818DRAFT_390762 [Hypoxylon cercidicola]|nr:hypothetical protein F4818DRAFT_390762 [Hypoxylon cercidicola]